MKGEQRSMIHDLLPMQATCLVPIPKHEKVEPCNGHLRVFYPFADFFSEVDAAVKAEIQKEFGSDKEVMVYKCRACGTIYRPRPDSILPKEAGRAQGKGRGHVLPGSGKR